MAEKKELELWYVPSPGEMLEEKIQEMRMDANDLAMRMGYTPKAVNDILTAKCSITSESAIALESVTRIPMHIWFRAQNYYDEFKAREKMKEVVKSKSSWVKPFPYTDISDRNWVKTKDEDKVSPLLSFFAVASPEAWKNYYTSAQLKVAFRISLAETKDPYAASVWLRRGEILADEHPMEKQDLREVRKKIRKALPEILAYAGTYKDKPKRHIAYKAPESEAVDEGMLKFKEMCEKIGLRILYVQNFKTAPIHGMYRWYRDVPLIQLHDRFEDWKCFWFTFFHELAHVLYHGKKGICIENIKYGPGDPEKEEVANCFAQKCMSDAGLM